MDGLESSLWVPAVITLTSVTIVIAKDYINGYRMIRRVRKISDQYKNVINQSNEVCSDLDQLAADISDGNYVR